MLAIMGLSWIYALYGEVGFVSGLFFGLKAAILAIILQAVIRIGKRALSNPTMIALAAVSFVAIFCFDAPFPAILAAAGLLGFLGARVDLEAFALGGGHAALGKHTVADAETILGSEVPQLRPGAPPLAESRCPPLAALAGAGCASRHPHRRRRGLRHHCRLLQQNGGRVRRRLCRLGLCRPGGRGELCLAQARRYAGRFGYGRNHTGAADHGDPVRRLHGRLSRGHRPAVPTWPELWAGS